MKSLLVLFMFLSLFITFYILLHLYFAKLDIDKHRLKNKNEIYKKINKLLKSKNEGYFSFNRINEFLTVRGNPLNISPGAYIVMKFFCSAFLSVTVFEISKSIIFAIISLIPGFFFIDLCLYISDRSDLKKIRFDLSDVCDLINIQTTAGVPVSAALLDACMTVSNRRLKQDLAVLSAEINMTNDVNQSLDNFAKKYNSSDINSFVMAIRQSMMTGQTEQIFDDISNSFKETNFIYLQEEGNKIKSSKILIQMLMYAGILAVIIFELFIEVSNSWGGILS